jgi:hypothetical protein
MYNFGRQIRNWCGNTIFIFNVFFSPAIRLLPQLFCGASFFQGNKMQLLESNTKTVTMTSLELVEFINLERGEDGAQLAHSDFLKKVPQVLGELVAGNFSSYYTAPDPTNGSIKRLPLGNTAVIFLDKRRLPPAHLRKGFMEIKLTSSPP